MTDHESACRSLGIDDNRAVWLDGLGAYALEPALDEDMDADVVIVGGGITGVSSAYQLSERFPERRIVLLEARALANGASGRNGGLVLTEVAGSYPSDPACAKQQYDAMRSSIDLIESLIAQHDLDVPFRRRGCLEVFTDAARAEAAAREVEWKNQHGIDAEFLDVDALRSRLAVEGAYGAVLNPHAGQINAAQFVRALKPVLLERGVRVFERTPVLTIERGDPVRVTTLGGIVSARALVLATNAYSRSLGFFSNSLVALHSHVFATEPSRQRSGVGWGEVSGFSDDRDRISYGGMSDDDRVVFGGGSNAAYRYAFGGKTGYVTPAKSAFPTMEKQLHRYLPHTASLAITHRWTGALAMTLSRVPVIGVEDNVYYGIGYSGSGITLATLSGRIIADLYAQDADRWNGLSFFRRDPAWIPPEPFRFLGYLAYTKVTGRSPRSRPSYGS